MFDIFISFKNDPVGILISKNIAGDLKEMGYAVYHNSDENHTGEFDKRLYETIGQCRDFLLIVSEGCLAQLMRHETVDWVREELLCAYANNKNIIPVLVEGVTLPKDKNDMPEDLRFLPLLESLSLPLEYKQLPPLQVLTGKLQSKAEAQNEYRDTYNSNPSFNVDELFSQTKQEAENGSRKAMYELASMYYYGTGENGSTYRDYEKAYALLAALSEGNDDYAAYADTMLARMYYGGFVPNQPQSYEKAFQYHKTAAPICRYSAHQYAFMLKIGSGCEASFSGAVDTYLSVIERNGDNTAIEGLAEMYLNAGKYREAAELYQKMSAFLRDSEYQLGMLYKNGVLSDPPRPDYFRASAYFHHAIESQECKADVYYQLATLYFNPTGGFPKDFKAAQKYFQTAADMGHPNAQYILGFMYEYGHVQKDLGKAIEYYSKAAKHGAFSCVHLAFLYQQPGFVNYQKAFFYAEKAALQGVMEGEYAYGVMLLLGRGCEPDVGKAYIFLKKAFAHGVYQAKQFIEKIEEMNG